MWATIDKVRFLHTRLHALLTENAMDTTKQVKTGILVHGCNLHTYHWKNIVWGKPPHDLGRIAHSVLLALCYDVEVMIFGTGASEKNGMLEADATVQLMFERFDRLQEFAPFQSQFPAIKQQGFRDKCRQKIESIVEIENTSQNTVEEVTTAGHIFNRHHVERIILVSSPTHLPRCLRDACVAFEHNLDLAHFRHRLHATPSITSYMDTSPGDVAIFEPPHRPDRPPFHINAFLKRVNDLPGVQREPFLKRFDDLLEEFDV